MSKNKKTEEPKKDVPAWIVSFTDMVTLLLAFFVLLQSFAQEQHPELFYVGQGSFNTAIQGLGIPSWLYGIKTMNKRSFLIKRHPGEPEENNKQRKKHNVINAVEERIQRIFQELKKNIEENTSKNLNLKTIRVISTPIRFSSNSTKLNSSAQSYLDSLALILRDSLPPESTAVYIIGLAPNESASQKSWKLSALRANTIKKYLRNALRGVKTKWTLHAWGGGQQYGQIPKGTEAGIIVMGANDGG